MKVLLLIWTNASWHPVVIFTAQMLSEQGHEVKLLYRTPDAEVTIPGSTDFGTHTQLQSIGHVCPRGSWQGRIDYLQFIRQAYTTARSDRPELIIGYDMRGAAAAYVAGFANRRARWVYNNLDLVADESLTRYSRLVRAVEKYAARRADLVIVSSSGRADVMQRQADLAHKPLVLMNCQRRHLTYSKTGELQNILRERGLHFERIIARLGKLVPGHGIEATIRSVPKWNEKWGLILAGAPIAGYLEKLHDLVASLHLEDQVIILPSVPYSLWYDCLYSADLGIALYEVTSTNRESMVGAGNRLNLYLKAGIPSIVPDIPDFVEFARAYGAAKVANPTDPDSIAAAVNAVLTDTGEYDRLSRNASLAFDTVFNFEAQFSSVLEWIAGKDK